MSEPKYRKSLNAEQLEVLELLYKFRFGSNNLIAEYFGKKDRSFVFKRLKILQDQGLIGKRFESSYRIQGKPAAYYLLPAGAHELQKHHDLNVKTIYRDKSVKEQFVRHCLDIFSIYNQLKAQYSNKLKFFTKANLNKFDYFPQSLPDAYIRLGEKQFFLYLLHDNEPFFTAIRNVKRYMDYADHGDWDTTETDLPVVLIICESASLQKRLRKRIIKILDDAWEEDLTFALTTKDAFLSTDARIWQLAADSDENLKLEDIS
jgi:protein involved in plasmid replication-relaxation